ncbi:hypothetical protein AYO38_08800 [bacterium SCGC AG-212-C10]|nr:hypothetical protein AYO38_08800 [bacterium SCGC AG-212-C10]
MRIVFLALIVLAISFAGVSGWPHTARAASPVVTTTADSGPGSLRQAILDVNAGDGSSVQTISFAIPGGGVQKIAPTTALPVITKTVLIDGYSQTGTAPNSASSGTNAVIVIELSGENLVENPCINIADRTGIAINGGNGSTVRGLAINRWSCYGISVTGGTNHVISGNFIGTDTLGTTARPNLTALFTANATNVTVGGTTAAARNLISGNSQDGVYIAFGNPQNKVLNNLIGTNASGTAALANGGNGVVVNDSGLNQIGAAGAGNVISGNHLGVLISSAGAHDNSIFANRIGTNAAGDAAIGNDGWGIRIEAQAPQNRIGGTGAGEGNLISGNGIDGVIVFSGNDTVFYGNIIGLNAAGTGALPNVSSGIKVQASIGVTIGDAGSSARNIISGNFARGIQLISSNNAGIQNNYIGSDSSGTVSIGNSHFGIDVSGSDNVIIGGPTSVGGNLIVGNGFGGIVTQNGGDNTVIVSNIIGLDKNLANELSNPGGGVLLNGPGARVGVFQGQLAPNMIFQANANPGVSVVGASSVGNIIRSNSIRTAGGGLAIDLANSNSFGVNDNDAGDVDTGANEYQNFPVITAAQQNTTTISGSLTTEPNQIYVLDFYKSPTCTFSTRNAVTYLGNFEVSTNATGIVQFAAPVAPGLVGQFVTATATDQDGNTSELSDCVPITLGSSGPQITSLSPEFAKVNGSANFELQIAGSGFVAGSTVLFNGSPLTPSSVTANSITVTVTPSDITGPAGGLSTNVQVRLPGNVFSDPFPFILTATSTADVDCSGVVNGADGVAILRGMAQLSVAHSCGGGGPNYDADRDGLANPADVFHVLKVVVGQHPE